MLQFQLGVNFFSSNLCLLIIYGGLWMAVQNYSKTLQFFQIYRYVFIYSFINNTKYTAFCLFFFHCLDSWEWDAGLVSDNEVVLFCVISFVISSHINFSISILTLLGRTIVAISLLLGTQKLTKPILIPNCSYLIFT